MTDLEKELSRTIDSKNEIIKTQVNTISILRADVRRLRSELLKTTN